MISTLTHISDIESLVTKETDLTDIIRSLGVDNTTKNRASVGYVLLASGFEKMRKAIWDKENNKTITSTIFYPKDESQKDGILDIGCAMAILKAVAEPIPLKELFSLVPCDQDSNNERGFIALARLAGYPVTSKSYHHKGLGKTMTKLIVYPKNKR